MVSISLPRRVHLIPLHSIFRLTLTLTLILSNLEKKLFSVAFGPISEGKPAKVDILVAESFAQVVAFCDEDDLLSVQLLPDKPIIVNV